MVRIGLGYVKGVRKEEMEALVAERERGGPYRGDRRPRLALGGRAGEPGTAGLGGGAGRDPAPAPGGERRARRSGGSASPAPAAAARGGTQLALPIEPPEPPRAGAARRLGRADRRLPLDRDRPRQAPDGADAPRPRPGDLLRSTELERIDDGATVEVAGMVVARQRPETAKGIVFMLLEDERGIVNLIVPKRVYERHRAARPHRRRWSAPAAGSSAAKASINVLVDRGRGAGADRAAGTPERRRRAAGRQPATPTPRRSAASSPSPSCAPSPPPATASARRGR